MIIGMRVFYMPLAAFSATAALRLAVGCEASPQSAVMAHIGPIVTDVVPAPTEGPAVQALVPVTRYWAHRLSAAGPRIT
jgi:hypothetical protein